MLSALGDIKKFRMDNAQAEVFRRRQQAKHCDEKEARARDELQQYQTWRAKEERRLYNDLKGNQVGLKDIDKIKHQVDKLRLKESSLTENIDQAVQERQRAEEELYQAERALVDSSKAFEKCQMLIEQVKEAENTEAQRREDLELEEAGESGFQRTQK